MLAHVRTQTGHWLTAVQKWDGGEVVRDQGKTGHVHPSGCRSVLINHSQGTCCCVM